jgi:hypothetical protein
MAVRTTLALILIGGSFASVLLLAHTGLSAATWTMAAVTAVAFIAALVAVGGEGM